VRSELILVVIFGVAALLAGIFLYRRPRPVEHLEEVSLGELGRCLDILLQRGYDLGFVVFEIPGDQRFLEYSKYVKDQHNRGVQLDFPRAPWSEPYYEQIKGLLGGKGIGYQVEDTPKGPVREFIQVDFGQDLAGAASTGKDIFERVFRVDPATRVTADFQHVAPAP
jgi:hypothetical protein